MSKVNDFLNETGMFFMATVDGAPYLRDIYNEKTGNKMMCFHLEDATAVDIAVMGEGVSLL